MTAQATQSQAATSAASTASGPRMPEQAIYGPFLRHLAIFEKHAQSSAARGDSKTATAFRGHLMRRFGLTSAEQAQLSQIASNYFGQWTTLRNQVKSEAQSYRDQYSLNKPRLAGSPAPPRDATLQNLEGQIRAITIASMTQIHAAVGDVRFAQIDQTIRGLEYQNYVQSRGATGEGQ